MPISTDETEGERGRGNDGGPEAGSASCLLVDGVGGQIAKPSPIVAWNLSSPPCRGSSCRCCDEHSLALIPSSFPADASDELGISATAPVGVELRDYKATGSRRRVQAIGLAAGVRYGAEVSTASLAQQ